MTYLLFAVSFFCVVFWPAVSGLLWLTGLAGDWRQAYRWGLVAVGAVWLLAVVDLTQRWARGQPLEPTADDEE